MRHKHADLIIAWANGADIQFWGCDRWQDFLSTDNTWNPAAKYRIKPKPDVVRYAGVLGSSGLLSTYAYDDLIPLDVYDNHIKLIFDGETLKLKSAEVI